MLTYGAITLRLLVAALLGGLVGLERERRNQPAGLRTHLILCLGAALIMLVSIQIDDFRPVTLTASLRNLEAVSEVEVR